MLCSRREFSTRARFLAAGDSLSAPALADPSTEIFWTMTSTFRPSLDSLWLNRRGVVVTAAGIVFGTLSEASLDEGSRGHLQSVFSANHAAVAGAHRISIWKAGDPRESCPGANIRSQRPPAIAPKLRAEIG